MALIQSIKDEHYLTFDDTKHRYALDGEPVPGVTTFGKGGYPSSFNLTNWMISQGSQYTLNLLQRLGRSRPLRLNEQLQSSIIKRSRTAWKKEAEEAANIGTILHDYAYAHECYKPFDMEIINTHPNKEKILECINTFMSWRSENKDEIVASEQIVASIVYQYGGKFDRLANRNGQLVLSDFKTSSGIYVDHFIQLASYKIAIGEWLGIKVNQLELLRFGKDGDFESLVIKKEDEVKNFEEQAIRCRQTYQFRKWENDKRFKYTGKSK